MQISFISKLLKTKLAMKIWLYLTLMVFSFILLIGLFLELYLSQYVENDERNAALRNTSHAATAFSSEYVTILEHFVSYTASSDFYDILINIQESNSNQYIENSTNLQSYLTQYSDISSLINTATISDNGAGIDVERATKIMKGEGEYSTKNNHIGLNNIYHRLTSFYRNVDITFSSIPFYENKITITIPYSTYLDAQSENK